MSKPYPCCGCTESSTPSPCWLCESVPDSIYMTGGADCCTEPTGTFALAGSPGAEYAGSRAYSWDNTLHEFNFLVGGHICSWMWEKAKSDTYTCPGGDLACVCLLEFHNGDDASAFNWYSVIINYLIVYVEYEHTGSVNTVRIVIERGYQVVHCSVGVAIDYRITDVYEADVDCEDLPTTISHTARYVAWTDHVKSTSGTTEVPMTYGYNSGTGLYNKYSFSAFCAPLSSVGVSYV